MSNYAITLYIGQRVLTISLPVYSTFLDLRNSLIEKGLIADSNKVNFLILSSNKIIDDMGSFVFSNKCQLNDRIKIIFSEDLAQIHFKIARTGYKISQNFKNNDKLESIIKYFQTQRLIKNEAEKIIFYNTTNKQQASPNDFQNLLNINQGDEILIFQGDIEFQRCMYESQYLLDIVELERKKYKEINKSQSLMEMVSCIKINHQPNKIQFICKNINCDSTPICCSLCFHEIHNNHKNIDDFVQLNCLEREDFSEYEKLIIKIDHLKLYITELLDGLNKLVQLLNPKKKLSELRQNPDYENATKLGYSIKFFYSIPNIMEQLEQMKQKFQDDLEKIYRQLQMGLYDNEIVKLSTSDSVDTDTQDSYSSIIAKNIKFNINTSIKKILDNEKTNLLVANKEIDVDLKEKTFKNSKDNKIKT